MLSAVVHSCAPTMPTVEELEAKNRELTRDLEMTLGAYIVIALSLSAMIEMHYRYSEETMYMDCGLSARAAHGSALFGEHEKLKEEFAGLQQRIEDMSAELVKSEAQVRTVGRGCGL